MSALRELYLCLAFIFGAGAVLAPYLGISVTVFAYQRVKGGAIDLPISVSLYACFVLIAVAALVLRLFAKSDTRKEGDVG